MRSPPVFIAVQRRAFRCDSYLCPPCSEQLGVDIGGLRSFQSAYALSAGFLDLNDYESSSESSGGQITFGRYLVGEARGEEVLITVMVLVDGDPCQWHMKPSDDVHFLRSRLNLCRRPRWQEMEGKALGFRLLPPHDRAGVFLEFDTTFGDLAEPGGLVRLECCHTTAGSSMDVRGGMNGEGNEDEDGDDGEYVPRRNPPLEEPSDDVQQLRAAILQERRRRLEPALRQPGSTILYNMRD